MVVNPHLGKGAEEEKRNENGERGSQSINTETESLCFCLSLCMDVCVLWLCILLGEKKSGINSEVRQKERERAQKRQLVKKNDSNHLCISV